MGKKIKGKDLFRNSLGRNIGVDIEASLVEVIYKDVAEKIGEDETVSLSFIGYNGFKNRVEVDKLYAYVLTNKNLYMAHRKDTASDIDVCALSELRDVSCRWGYNWSVLVMDQLNGEIRIGVPTKDVEEIAKTLWILGGMRWDALKVPEDMRMSMEQSKRLHSALAR